MLIYLHASMHGVCDKIYFTGIFDYIEMISTVYLSATTLIAFAIDLQDNEPLKHKFVNVIAVTK